jgi:hypothetical protein
MTRCGGEMADYGGFFAQYLKGIKWRNRGEGSANVSISR